MPAQYTPPAHSDEIRVSFPQEHTMLLVINRPKALNAVSHTMTSSINDVLNWFNDEPSLWVVVITGQGRTFCAGADLVAWRQQTLVARHAEELERIADDHNGFASLSRRTMVKPIIAAVNGSAYGGGTEIVLNCDIVVASEEAVFLLPEVKHGVVAIQGGIPRLGKVAGHQRASEMLFTARPISAHEAYTHFGFVNKVVPKSQVLATALDFARQINLNSPDAIQSTKRALLLTRQKADVEDAVAAHVYSPEGKRSYLGDNMKEGLNAFVERRKPVWKNPAKL
ncbi:enoyl-CoA hydratase/carnithine racemase [Cristinia sonorae]|uniref:Enoyl-CoA hydratase/carnithine racemase n=1 Tax=Cristinia sonorae TaxID=1940300 RepID=A0A8K0UMM6_9AGAR|nr:enoyl-CoA hydratase/carnithine racemase [Cristinia sonorae]